MIYYVELGTEFTNTYGDVDLPFYNSLLSVFEKAVKACEGDEQLHVQFSERLFDVVEDSDRVGWGYHDGLTDLYYSLSDWKRIGDSSGGDGEVNGFSVIKKENEYWLVDQVKSDVYSEQDYVVAFDRLLGQWREEKVGYLSLLMDAAFEDWLLNQGFSKISTVVEYTRQLSRSFPEEPEILVEALADGEMADSNFADLYERCRSGSANKNKLFTIEQVMESLENELGQEWRTYCFIFRKSGEPIGLSIPIIEQGTVDEGRLFYFGVVPECRGKGYGSTFHRISLHLLQGMGATTYVGSTDEANLHMIRIFQRNDCVLRDRKGIYRIDR